MKKLFQHIRLAGLLFLAIAVFSCKEGFLEVTPKGKLLASKTIDYNRLLNVPHSVNITLTIPMSDEVAAVNPYFSSSVLRTQRLFRWEDDIYDEGVAAPELTQLLTGLYIYNKVINEVMASAEGTEEQKRSLQAEAMACRAWTYFYFINLYGKPYQASSAATDPGFFIIKEADVTENGFTRASVKDVYDFIVADLSAAIPNLPAQTTHRLRMSKAPAEILLGKVYLFMGKYTEALQQFNAAFADMTSSAIPIRLYDYNVTLGPGGSFLPIGPGFPSIFAYDDLENLLARTSSNSWALTLNEIVIPPQTVALYGATDLRLKFYTNTPYPSGSPFPPKMMRRVGPSALKVGVSLPDLYLLRAESKARLNDLAGAKADVEALRKNRMPAANATVPASDASDRVALVKYILEERIREFAVQGYRWFDMRRLSVDPEFSSTVGITHTLYSASGTVESTFTLRPERLVMRLPSIVIEQNPTIQNNP